MAITEGLRVRIFNSWDCTAVLPWAHSRYLRSASSDSSVQWLHGCVTSEHGRYQGSACKADRPCHTLLPITSSTELGFEWFEMVRKDNSKIYNFHEDIKMKFIYKDWPKFPWSWLKYQNTKLKLKSSYNIYSKMFFT